MRWRRPKPELLTEKGECLHASSLHTSLHVQMLRLTHVLFACAAALAQQPDAANNLVFFSRLTSSAVHVEIGVA